MRLSRACIRQNRDVREGEGAGNQIPQQAGSLRSCVSPVAETQLDMGWVIGPFPAGDGPVAHTKPRGVETSPLVPPRGVGKQQPDQSSSQV